jgi:hypothetical protein
VVGEVSVIIVIYKITTCLSCGILVLCLNALKLCLGYQIKLAKER